MTHETITHRILTVLVSTSFSEMMIAMPISADIAKKTVMKIFPRIELPYLIVPILSIISYDSRKNECVIRFSVPVFGCNQS